MFKRFFHPPEAIFVFKDEINNISTMINKQEIFADIKEASESP